MAVYPTGGRPVGPYVGRGRARAVGPYALRRPGGMGTALATVGKAINKLHADYAPPIKAKAITRTLRGVSKSLNHDFSTGKHVAAPRRGKAVPDVSPTKPADSNNRNPAIHLPPVKVGRAAGGGAGPGGFSKQLGRVMGQAMSSLINPAQYARSAANAKYGGLISDLASQISHAPADQAQHQADIASWFGTAGRSATDAAQQIGARANDAASSADASTKGIIDALGGGAAGGSVGALGAIASAGLRGSGQTDADFANNLATSIGAEGAYQKRNQSTLDANALGKLRSELSQARLDQGNEYATALSQAQGQRFTQLGQLQNMMLGQQLAGPQYASALLNNKLAAAKVGQAEIDRQTATAQLKDFQNKVNNPTGQFDSLQAPDRAKLGDLITGLFVGKAGRLRQSPKSVGPSVRNYLYNTAGFPKSAATEAFANGITNQILTGGSGAKSHGRGLTRAQEYRVGHRRH